MASTSPLIAILVIGIGLAFVFGALAHRLRMSPIAGYLLAGVVIGPFTPGFVADPSLTNQLADVGVILLMFGVGLHFSLKDLLAVRRIVVPGALAQMSVVTALGILVAWLIGWSLGAGLVYGLALSVASTVVLTRSLQERHLMETERGHIAMGWLIFQDLVTVFALVLIPPLASVLTGDAAEPASFGFGSLLGAVGLTLGKLVAFIALMLIVGKRAIPAMLHYIAYTGSRELFRLAVLSVALGVAFVAAELFGVSFALGAFFGGLVLSESQLSQRAAEESLPLRDAFAVLFFVSEGMLFNPRVILTAPEPLIATLAVVMLGSAGSALLMVGVFKRPLADAVLIGAGLAQIGEFSFILSGLGISLDILPQEARDLIVGTSIISIFANPFLFAAAERWKVRHEPKAAAAVARSARPLQPTLLTNHAILIGYGRVGQLVGENLAEEGWPLLVIETATDLVERLRAGAIEVISGNAAEEEVLRAANVPGARLLLVAIPNGFEAGQIIEQARAANPDIEIVARAHFDAEVDYLFARGANSVIMGEREIARTMMDYARAKKTVLLREPVKAAPG